MEVVEELVEAYGRVTLFCGLTPTRVPKCRQRFFTLVQSDSSAGKEGDCNPSSEKTEIVAEGFETIGYWCGSSYEI